MRKLLILFLPLLISSAMAWCNTDYEYYTTILVNHDKIINDYSVLLNISYNPLIKEDFSDLLFYGQNCVPIPNYFQKVVNSSHALIWVKTDVRNGDVPVFMYYHYSGDAVSQSDFKSSFRVGDDFDDGMIDNSLWQINYYSGTSNWTEENGVLNWTCNQSVSNQCDSWVNGTLSNEGVFLEARFEWAQNEVYQTSDGNNSGNNEATAFCLSQYQQLETNRTGLNRTWWYTDFYNWTPTNELKNQTVIVDISYDLNDTPSYTIINQEIDSHESGCLVMRQVEDGTFEFLTASSCSDSSLTFINSSSLSSGFRNYYIIDPYNYGDNTTGWRMNTFDNFWIRAYDGGTSNDSYSSDEPTYTIGNTFHYGYYTELGKDTSGFLSHLAPILIWLIILFAVALFIVEIMTFVFNVLGRKGDKS